MLPVEQPFKTYTDLDGKPLHNGYVWFGQPNQNPITAPVTVYWDAAGTIPAAQPLRTVNGYIMRGGTPANVFFDGSYSVLVQDAKGRQVSYARSIGSLSAPTGAAQIGTSTGDTVEQRLAAALTLVDVGGGGVPVFAAGTPAPGVAARFAATEQIGAHAHYGFLDNSTVTYASGGFQAHASFNDNVKFAGPQDSDHHHSFQAYPHYNGTGTLRELSCFWAQPEVTAGAVTELSTVCVNNAIGSAGTIGTQYGIKINPLTRGGANYAIYVSNPTVSYFGGALVLGQIGVPAYIMYNPNSGNLDLIPRTGYGVAIEGPLLFGASTGEAASIAYNLNGNLDIKPRANYHTTMPSGSLLIGTATAPASGERLNVTAPAADFVARFYNTDPTSPKGLALVYPAASPNGTGNEFLYCQDSMAIRMKVLSNGNLQNVNNSYGALSDLKLKENIVDATPKLADLMNVRVVNYNLKNDPSHKQLGVIAQELAELFPGMIEESVDFEDVVVEPARTETTTTRRQKTAKRDEVHIVPTLVDGQWRNVPTTVEVDAPLFDEHPLFDALGQPLMELVEAGHPEVVKEDGTVIQPGKDAVYRQRVHREPVIEEITHTIDVPARTERRATGTTTKSVKYSVFVPMLIKAMQEQQARIESLEALMKDMP